MNTIERFGLESANVRDAFLEVAEIIHDREQLSITSMGRDMFTWTPVNEDAFQTPIELYQAVRPIGDDIGKYAVKLATFKINGDEGEEITVSRDFEDNMNNDSYAEYLFERFASTYLAHHHTFCIRTVRIARAEQVRKQNLIAQHAKSQINIIDKRKVPRNPHA